MTYYNPDEPYLPAIADQVAARIRDVVSDIQAEAKIDAQTAMWCGAAYNAVHERWWPIAREMHMLTWPFFSSRDVCHALGLLQVEFIFRGLAVKLLTMHDPMLGDAWLEGAVAELLDAQIRYPSQGVCYTGDPRPTENRTN